MIYGLDSRGDRFIYILFEFTMARRARGTTIQIRIEKMTEITVAPSQHRFAAYGYC